MTVVRDPRRIAVLVVLGVLAGAMAFGLWHIVVGGLINGNPRAAAFGTALALVAGTLPAGSIALIRRRATH